MARRLIVCAAGLAAAIVAGCATTGASPGAAVGVGPAADPCALLTVEEVAGALSTDPVLTAARDPDIPQCHYWIAAADQALELTVITSGVDDYLDIMLGGAAAVEAVPGVGDGAAYSTADRELTLETSGVIVRLRAVYASDAVTTLANLKALAAIVVARAAGQPVAPEVRITPPPLVVAQDACDLLSAEEAAAIVGVAPLSVLANDSTPTFCYFNLASGEPAVTTYLDRKGGLAVWETVDDYGGEHISGLGNDAVWEPAQSRLSVLKGDTIINVSVFLSLGQDEVLALDRRLIDVMLTHL